ncbi:MAG: hypothetical protein HGA90_01925, partial [Alphaproteobacteria bacterium]|nr:hypothetical protein [Alphaproteobacteria bacterium]
VGLWVALNAVREKQRASQAVDEVWQISKNIRDLYTGQRPAAYPSTAAAQIEAGVFPQDLLNVTATATGNPINPWGGAITVEFPPVAAPPQQVDIMFWPTAAVGAGLFPISVCVDFLTRLPATGQEGSPVEAFLSNVVPISVNNATPAGIITLSGGSNFCTNVRFRFSL